jgi:hypothetical protein
MKINGQVISNDRKYTGSDYVMAKLMEHSYIGNWLLDSVAAAIYKENCEHNEPVRLAWVGDYADADNDKEVSNITNGELTYDNVWGEKTLTPNHVFNRVKHFGYHKRFLVNLDKKLYISFDWYLKYAKENHKYTDLIINPISLLTAIGNGRGGGDYSGTHEDLVGSWAWDRITINDKAPVGFTELKITFE